MREHLSLRDFIIYVIPGGFNLASGVMMLLITEHADLIRDNVSIVGDGGYISIFDLPIPSIIVIAGILPIAYLIGLSSAMFSKWFFERLFDVCANPFIYSANSDKVTCKLMFEFNKGHYEMLDDYLKTLDVSNTWTRYRDIMMFIKHSGLPILITSSLVIWKINHEATILFLILGIIYLVSIDQYFHMHDKRLLEMVNVYKVKHCSNCKYHNDCYKEQSKELPWLC